MPTLVTLAVASTLMTANADTARCHGATTPEVETCLTDTLAAAEAEWRRYAAVASRRAAADGGPDLSASEAAFRAYRDAECDAVDRYKQGTARPSFVLSCRIRLTRLHVHTLWVEWLRYVDNTPPLLPKPSVPADS